MNATIRSTLALTLLAASIAGPAWSADEDGNKILQKVKDTMLGKTIRSTFVMTVEKPKDKRTSKARLWMEGVDNAFIYYDAPAADKGTKFLRINGNQLFMYQPRTEKVIRLAGSMMKASAMDSDFSYEDLLRQSTIYDDYNAKVAGKDKLGGQDAIVLDLTLKANRASYPMVKMWVHPTKYFPLKQEYYEGGKVVKTNVTDKSGDMGGRTIPTTFTFSDLHNKDQKTVITIEAMEFNKPLEKKIFSQSYLQRQSVPQ